MHTGIFAVTHPSTVLLDTNHLSVLARQSSAPAAAPLIRLLQHGDAQLVMTVGHLVELSHPSFSSIPDVRSLLADVRHVFANPFEDVTDEEIACACARAAGRSRRPPRVFAADTSTWGYHIGPTGGNAVDMLDAMMAPGTEREGVVAVAQWGAQASMLKTDAALIRSPLLPLSLAVQRHLDGMRATTPGYADNLTAPEIISRVGGRRAFPGYDVQESLVEVRLRDVNQKSQPNDVFDEHLAFFAPYTSVTAVDRGTYHRAKMAQVPCLERMTPRLAEVLGILDRVANGELTPLAAAW